jgi:hypothetical protein
VIAVGEDPAYVMGQLGHTDPAFTLRLYAPAMHRPGDERERLRALITGNQWAPMGTSRGLQAAVESRVPTRGSAKLAH